MANIKKAYQTPINLPVTTLTGIATSIPLTVGWLSDIIINTSLLDLDKIITGKIVLNAGALSAAQICVYAIAQLDDATWPVTALATGTFGLEGPGSFKDATNRDSVAVLVWATGTRAGANSDVYQIAASSLAGAFGGILPSRCVLFVTHSTGAALGSGHQITVKGTYETVV
jgi:hypothetical protein